MSLQKHYLEFYLGITQKLAYSLIELRKQWLFSVGRNNKNILSDVTIVIQVRHCP